MEFARRKVEDKAFQTFIRMYSLFKSERLNAKIKLTLMKSTDSVCNVLCLSRLGVFGRIPSIENAVPSKTDSAHYWKLSKAHIGPRFACGFQNSLRI
jgi:hypothetical protein